MYVLIHSCHSWSVEVWSPALRLVGNLRTGAGVIDGVAPCATLLLIVIEEAEGIAAEDEDGDEIARCHDHHAEIYQCPHQIYRHQGAEEYEQSEHEAIDIDDVVRVAPSVAEERHIALAIIVVANDA